MNGWVALRSQVWSVIDNGSVVMGLMEEQHGEHQLIWSLHISFICLSSSTKTYLLCRRAHPFVNQSTSPRLHSQVVAPASFRSSHLHLYQVIVPES